MFCEKTKRIQYLHRYLHINKYRYWIANVLVGFIYDLLGTYLYVLVNVGCLNKILVKSALSQIWFISRMLQLVRVAEQLMNCHHCSVEPSTVFIFHFVFHFY
jgi:hypothetical protein